jgi:hypothetical protein
MTTKHENMWKTAMQFHAAAMQVVAGHPGDRPAEKQLWAVGWLCYHSRNLQTLAAARHLDEVAFEQSFEKIVHFARQVVERFTVATPESNQVPRAPAA